jgi:mandelate racemase
LRLAGPRRHAKDRSELSVDALSLVNREVSSHLFPEVSAHLLAATPGRHWLEYVDWAVPLLQEPLQIVDGLPIVPNRAGNGMRWDEAAVAKFKLD